MQVKIEAGAVQIVPTKTELGKLESARGVLDSVAVVDGPLSQKAKDAIALIIDIRNALEGNQKGKEG